MKSLILTFLCLASLYGAGPTRVATFDRTLWLDKINDKSSYDKASRYEILSFVNQINLAKFDLEDDIKLLTRRDKVNVNSVKKWKEFTKQNLLNNFKKAQQSCSDKDDFCDEVLDFESLSLLAKSYKPSDKQAKWYEASQKFFSYYLYEQVRLAALSPNITSEIETLDDSEVQGFKYNDGEFLLTFDDGPKYTKTKKVVDMLRNENINGIFFVLGENLQRALKTNGKEEIKQLYSNSCVGSHAYIHKSHQRLKTWKSSYDKSRKLIIDNNLSNISNNSIWFRPPYGQRHKELINHLKTLNDKVMLWNIDSQDWNRKLNAKKVQDRVLTLMLVHRKGILLFHDVHNKAFSVVKNLNVYNTKKIFNFLDCRKVSSK